MTELSKSVYEELILSEDGKKINFSVSKLPSAYCDSSLMKQVFINLISNAIKYSSKRENPVIEVGSVCNYNEICYFVKDNGVGFNMEYANKLFGVFQRLHSAKEFEGNGVGLAIVHRIILRHGGRVWGEGKVDKGAAFYFSLPVKGKK